MSDNFKNALSFQRSQERINIILVCLLSIKLFTREQLASFSKKAGKQRGKASSALFSFMAKEKKSHKYLKSSLPNIFSP